MIGHAKLHPAARRYLSEIGRRGAKLQAERNLLHLNAMGVVEVGHEARFIGKAQPPLYNLIALSDETSCWPWKGKLAQNGYPYVTICSKCFPAHRAIFILSYGINPGRKEVCHLCDNPPCVNPFHMVAASHRDNIVDARDKGLMNTQHGTKCGVHKLTEEQIPTIRMLAQDGLSFREIGRRFGVNHHQISRIVFRRGWTHVP